MEKHWQPSGSVTECPVCRKDALHLETKRRSADPALTFCGTCLKVVALDTGEIVTSKVISRYKRVRERIYECMISSRGYKR